MSEFRIVVCGPRDKAVDHNYLEEQFCRLVTHHIHLGEDVILLNGMAEGIDKQAREVLGKWPFVNEVREYPAIWAADGYAAGPIRNAAMAKECHTTLAFWDGKSPGTLSMIKETIKAGKPVTVLPLSPQGDK